MKSRKSYIKRFVAYAVMFAMILGICPQIQKQHAEAATTYAASLSQLGKLGAFKAGSKGKGGNDNWWKMTVNGKASFCLNLGLTCHSGDTYEEKSSGTYKSHGSGDKGPWYACIGYWYDQVQNRKNKAFAMAQALCWTIEEEGTSKSNLVKAIQTVQTNTGWFSSKSADDMYTTIFQYLDADKAEVQADYTRYEYTGSQSGKRQVLMNLGGVPTPPQWKTYSTSKRYRQRITLYKKDEDGNPLANVEFSLTVDNVDECYYILCNGAGEATEEADFGSANTDFFTTTNTTDAGGRLYYIFAFRLQTKDYGYVDDTTLATLDDDAKKAVKAEMDEDDVSYGSGLTQAEAQALAADDLNQQFAKISNTFFIQETNTNNGNLVVDTDYGSGKTITIDSAHSWFRDDANDYWEDKHWQDEGNGNACDYSKNIIENVTNDYKRVSYRIKKNDDYSTDKKAHGNATLQEAKYRLYSDPACTVPATVYTDAEGTYSAECPVLVTDADGGFTTPYLRSGITYYLKEVEPSRGYLLNGNVIPFLADASDRAEKVTPNKQTIEATETPILGKIQMFKVEDDNISGGSSLGKWEVGSQFKIYLQSDGSYEASDDYERDIITVNSEGVALSKDLYYGAYIVEQISTGGADTEMLAPFPVIIEHPNVTKTFVGIDPIFRAYLRVVKKDGNTEKSVLKSGTTYQIYKVKDSGEEELVTQSTSNGNKVETCDTWRTDESGIIMTYKALPSGKYRIYETESATGLHVTKDYIEVDINSKAQNYVVESDGIETTYTVVEVDYVNDETHGRLSLKKTGEQLSGFTRTATTETGSMELSIDTLFPITSAAGSDSFFSMVNGKFIWEETSVRGAVFEVYAEENIETQDGQGDFWFKKGDLAATVTTGEGAEFTSKCGGITSYETDEDGIVTIDLPLGKYKIIEKETLYGYVLPEKNEWTVEFTWDNKDEAFVYDSLGTTDENGLLTVDNKRAKPALSITKEDSSSGKTVSDTVFGLYASNDIYNAKGEMIVRKDTLLTMVTTGNDGKATVDSDLPLMSEGYVPETESGTVEKDSAEESDKKKDDSSSEEDSENRDSDKTEKDDAGKALNSGDYYFKEIRISDSYYLDENPVKVHLEYKDMKTREIVAAAVKKNNQTEVEIDKLTLAGNEELPGATLQLTDKNGNVIAAWISGNLESVQLMADSDKSGYRNLSASMTDKGNLMLKGLLKNAEYTLTETKPADGYATAESIVFMVTESTLDKGKSVVSVKNSVGAFDLQETNVIKMFDDVTKVDISKTDITGSEEVPGCELTVTDKDTQTEIETWTSTEEAHRIEKLVVGRTYTLTEKRPAKGYVTADSIDFVIQDTGEVQSCGMKDDTTKIRFFKLAGDTGQGLPGAAYQVLDSEDNVVLEFKSNEEGVDITGKLAVGETYTFHEVSAPEGYKLAEDVELLVEDTADVQEVSVTDEAVEIPPVPQTGGTTPIVLSALFLLASVGAWTVVFRKKRMAANEKR
ncbi:MAG: SpaA isopeptide-forming pilin-related protein [Roseburia sp.]|nr:SpaA isopeptide-forming pilin-related protein [Roseburia sp.]